MSASESNIFLNKKATTNSTTKKPKESLAVWEESWGVEEYRNLSEMFHFSFLRMCSGTFCFLAELKLAPGSIFKKQP